MNGSAARRYSSIVDDLVEAHLSNPAIKARFLPYLDDPDTVAKVKRNTCDFFGAGSGGPETYTGRSMLDAHRGMNISAQEYMAAIDDILSVLDKHKIDVESRKDVLALAYSLKSEILHV